MWDHIPVTVFQVESPTVAPLLLCLPHLLVDLRQPLVLTVRQTLLVFSHLLLVNWSSHWITSNVKTRRGRAAFKHAAPPTQTAGGRPRRTHQPSRATVEVTSSLCKPDEVAARCATCLSSHVTDHSRRVATIGKGEVINTPGGHTEAFEVQVMQAQLRACLPFQLCQNKRSRLRIEQVSILSCVGWRACSSV